MGHGTHTWHPWSFAAHAYNNEYWHPWNFLNHYILAPTFSNSKHILWLLKHLLTYLHNFISTLLTIRQITVDKNHLCLQSVSQFWWLKNCNKDRSLDCIFKKLFLFDMSTKQVTFLQSEQNDIASRNLMHGKQHNDSFKMLYIIL